MAKVSVIIATHSRPHLLPRAVESAWKAGKDVEVIVVDDASTDSTAEVCSKLKDIKYIRLEHNQRTAGARNVGILASEGDYITFLDDDDVRFAESLDYQLDLLERDPNAGFVYSPVCLGNQDLEIINSFENDNLTQLPSGDIFWDLMQGSFIACGSVVFRKNCLLKVGLLNSNLAGFDDWDIWVRISELFPVIFGDKPVGVWRKPTPFSGQGTSNLASLFLRLEKHQISLFNLPKAKSVSEEKRKTARKNLRKWVSDRLIWTSIDWLSESPNLSVRGLMSVLKNVSAAFRVSPLRVLHPLTLRMLLREFVRLIIPNTHQKSIAGKEAVEKDISKI